MGGTWDQDLVIAAIDRARTGIAQYLDLMNRFSQTNVAIDAEFQRKFNRYYRVRQRSEEWYRKYYNYMQAQKGLHPSFSTTLRFLHKELDRYEPSFTSKLVATHNPELPVWDAYVLANTGIQAPGYAAPDRLRQAEAVYSRLQDWYADCLSSPEGHRIIALFDEHVTEHNRLTDLKKLDFVLWQLRPDAEAPMGGGSSDRSGGLSLAATEGAAQGMPPRPAFRAVHPEGHAWVNQPTPTLGTPTEDVLYIVSCVSQKRSDASPARELYALDWFRKARAFVERTGAPWFILSAEYGLVRPEAVIAPYEKTLNTLGVRERRVWADHVIDQMERELPAVKRVVPFAGQRYREFLLDYLHWRFEEILVPLEGLRIGEQLGWFAKRLGEGR